MYIIAGLGNPGKRYEMTKHNVGFLTVDLLAMRHNIKVNKLKHKALCGEGFIGNEKILLAKPQTFMNLSGESLLDMVRYYKTGFEKIIVIYDDIDINAGTLRIRTKGSAGSHNGMKSVIYHLQTEEFPRIRIGIGKPEGEDLSAYVLSPFNKEETTLVRKAVEKAADAVETIVCFGIQEAMNKYNG